MQANTPRDDVAFSSTERDRHLGIRPVSQLNTCPVVSPVNASRRPSRDAAHHSGSGRLAKPSPWGTCTSYSLTASWRTPGRVNLVARLNAILSEVCSRGYGTRDPTHVVKAAPTAIQDRHTPLSSTEKPCNLPVMQRPLSQLQHRAGHPLQIRA